MYRIMALADYEDRFVIPTTHREEVEDAYDLRGDCGFTDGNGCSTGISSGSLFGRHEKALEDACGGEVMDRTLKSLSLILSYPTQDLQAAMQEIGDILDSDHRLSGATRRSLRLLVQELRSRDI